MGVTGVGPERVAEGEWLWEWSCLGPVDTSGSDRQLERKTLCPSSKMGKGFNRNVRKEILTNQ